MRRLRNGKRGKPRKKTGPLAEDIIVPFRGNGQRDWKSLSDDEVVTYATKLLENEGIRSRKELYVADNGLYYVLSKRKLLDEIGLERLIRDWKSMSDDEIVEYARRIVEEKGLKSRNQLRNTDGGLYNALKKRSLLGKVREKERHHRDWTSMSDEEILRLARKVVEDNSCKTRGGFKEIDGGLHEVLRKKGLLDRVGIKKPQRDWISLSDGELLEHACSFVERRGLKSRWGLGRADVGLYQVLRNRGLLDRVLPTSALDGKRPRGFFTEMNDGELVAYARRIIDENRINNRKQLVKADPGLHKALRKRELLDRIGLDVKRRDWSSMSDEEIVAYGRRVIHERGIDRRYGLWKADRGLYSVLIKRRLIDKIIHESLHSKKKRRNWTSVSNDELVEYARSFMEKEGIGRRGELAKSDRGLYDVLKKRDLLDTVFTPLESEQQKQAVQDVLDAMKEFDGS